MKNIQQYFTKRNFIFIAIFTVIGFLVLQIPITQLVGSKVKFTVYDAFSPVAGAFIGTIPGVIAVFLMQFFNFLSHGANISDAGTIIRFFPTLFAVAYFAKKQKFNLVVPVIAIIAFVANPIGRTVWYFAFFWTIPIIMYFFRDKSLLARALGSTFTAHAVGGALWVWFFSLPAHVWIALIPVVIAERLLFTVGISVSFILVNNLLCFLEKKNILNLNFSISQKYLTRSLRSYYATKAQNFA